MTAEPIPDQGATAVSYLRVSTKEQAERDGDPEGYSIPAQRAANRRKAESLDATVVAEFVDRGESARSADRQALKDMLAYVRDEQIQYVIVHKVDRLARNRMDDVEITLALKKAGAILVSASENIDETPSGMLLHGIMSSIAEFYSRNLATEVVKGMSQKALSGGTPGRAPIGYRNVIISNEQGRPVRTVVIDEERGALIAWAFTAYATGEWTILKLAGELEKRGLTTVPSAKGPSKAVRRGQLHKILTNPYYKGVVTYRDAQYDGRHVALTDAATWNRVQEILETHRHGEKEREHPHYLRSSLICGTCASRMIVTMTKNRYGTVYPYFICLGRHQKTTNCERRAAHIGVVEELVVEEYRRVQLSHESRVAIEKAVSHYLDQRGDLAAKEERSLLRQRQRLVDQRAKLLHAYYADALSLDLLKTEQARVSKQLDLVEEQLATHTSTVAVQKHTLSQALDLLENCHRLYEQASDHDRRILNQAIFERIWIYNDRVTGDLDEFLRILTHPDLLRLLGEEDRPNDGETLPHGAAATPYGTGARAVAPGRRGGRTTNKPSPTFVNEGLKDTDLVPPVGFEPTPPPPEGGALSPELRGLVARRTALRQVSSHGPEYPNPPSSDPRRIPG